MTAARLNNPWPEALKHPIPRKIIIFPTHSLFSLIPALFVAAVFLAHHHQAVPNVMTEFNHSLNCEFVLGR